MMSYCKKMKKYFKKNPMENSAAHFFLGLGAGFLFTYPLAQSHPVRWGAVFVMIGIVMHLKAAK